MTTFAQGMSIALSPTFERKRELNVDSFCQQHHTQHSCTSYGQKQNTMPVANEP